MHPCCKKPIAGRRFWFIVWVVLIWLAWALPVHAEPSVRLACVKTTLHPALLDIAHARGLFPAAGVRAERVDAVTGKQALELVMEGKADIAAVAETPIMNAILNGAEILIIATIFKSDKSEMILARKDASIVRPQDLKGKWIGLSKGTSQEFFFETFLTWHGIPRNSLTVINMSPDEYTKAILEGKVSAVVTAFPRVPRLMRQLNNKGIIFYSGGAYTETYNLVTTLAFAQKNGNVIKQVLKAIHQAEKFAHADPSAAQAIAARAIGQDIRLVREIWGDLHLHLSLDQALVKNLEHQARWAIRNRLTKATSLPRFTEWIHKEFLREIVPASVTVY